MNTGFPKGLNNHQLEDSLPKSLPDRDHMIGVLTRLGDEAKESSSCTESIQDALLDFRESTRWDDVLSYNACVMTEFSKLPDEFFEEYGELRIQEWYMLQEMLQKINFPKLLPV